MSDWNQLLRDANRKIQDAKYLADYSDDKRTADGQLVSAIIRELMSDAAGLLIAAHKEKLNN